MLSRRLLRIKTVKSLYSYFKSEDETMARSEKELQASIRKCYELYLMMLGLVAEVAEIARDRIEIAQAKLMPTEEDLHPNLKFVNNRVVTLIGDSTTLNDAYVRHKTGWTGYRTVIKKLYQDMLEAPYYKEYMASEKNSFAEDRKFVIDFLSHHIEDNPYLEEALEESSLYWVDDIIYATGMAVKTIQYTTEKSKDLTILPMYKNEDDREYVESLFHLSLLNQKEYFEYIDQFTQNWDFDRIAFMDKLIMLAAITELIRFETIPVKVTLDEFIEISKYYSTPGSSVFVNGILDKIVIFLTEKGKIKKSGRGLIDTSLGEEIPTE